MNAVYHAHARFLDSHGNKITVPAPWDTGDNIPCHYDWVSTHAPMLRQCGFDAVLLPPPFKTISGRYNNADGYGVYDHRDIGSKNQYGSVTTRFGTREELQRTSAVCHAAGLNCFTDMVCHQVMGGNNGEYPFPYLPWHPGCFRGNPPRRPQDPVPNPYFDFAFGDEFVYKNCLPVDYTYNAMIQLMEELFRACDFDGARVDDVKGTWEGFIWQLLRSVGLSGKYFVSEYFDGNCATLNDWAVTQMGGVSSLFDFNMHFALQGVLDHGASMQSLNGAGFSTWQPFLSAGFLDNPDTDLSYGENIVNSKLLGYAILMGLEGLPFVYHKDYWTGAGCYGLKPWIDNLLWIRGNLAFGKTVTQFVDENVFVYNRVGSPGVLMAINRDTYNSRQITCPTSFGPYRQLWDYTGRHASITTDRLGNASFLIPPNAYGKGQGYLAFGPVGYTQAFTNHPRTTTQRWIGAAGRDIPAAPANTKYRVWPRAWCDEKKEFHIPPSFDSQITYELIGPIGAVVPKDPDGYGLTDRPGYHTLEVTNHSNVDRLFTAQMTYQATQGLDAADWAKFNPTTGEELESAAPHIDQYAKHIEHRLNRRRRAA